MKTIFLLFCIFIAFGLTSCGPEPATVSKSEFDDMKKQVGDAFQEVSVLQEYVASQPSYYLWLMDRDLDALEAGNDPAGSFTDYFMPSAHQALLVGAPKREVWQRIERAIQLADSGVYLSGYLHELMTKGGGKAVRAYAEKWLNPMN